MARPKSVVGTCHICGAHGPLTFEHIPPKAAFNHHRTMRLKMDDVIALGPDASPSGPAEQGGIGKHTLCGKCNNDTGAWYGGRFVEWCYQGMDILIKAEGRPTLAYINHIYPLEIIKQIATMFFSVNNEKFREAHPDLVKFVLDPRAKGLPPDLRFFVYFCTSSRWRFIGTSGIMRIDRNETIIVSEMNYPPYGYVLTLGSAPPDDRLLEITHFSRCTPGVCRDIPMQIPVLPTHSMYPGDYRTREEILRTAAQNRAP